MGAVGTCAKLGLTAAQYFHEVAERILVVGVVDPPPAVSLEWSIAGAKPARRPRCDVVLFHPLVSCNFSAHRETFSP
jgi:hypothetical protein